LAKKNNDNLLQEKANKILNSECTKKSILITKDVQSIIKKMNLGEESIISSILYFPYTHNHITKEYLSKNFSENIVTMLKSLEKLHKTNLNTNKKDEAKNIRRMFLAISRDIRVIFIRLAFALAEMRSINMYTKKEQEYKVKINLDIFAPLASNLGLSKIKSELEDRSFKVLNPKIYEKIETKIDEEFKGSKIIIASINKNLTSMLKLLNVDGEVMGRKKHIYSIYRKTMNKNCDLSQIYDMIAFRILVKTIPECYTVLGKIQEEFTPLIGRFKDYIILPKFNGYQSLHTTVLFNSIPVEIQIRTFEMHKNSEFGISAHWVYKEKRIKMNSFDTKLKQIRELIEQSNSMTNEELINAFKVDLYEGEIFVQSPKGKIIHLQKDSTPVDFAYAIHTEIGNKCMGAKVNGKMVALSTTLKNEDIVEIIVSSKSNGPSRDWLKFTKTFAAKKHIKNSCYKK